MSWPCFLLEEAGPVTEFVVCCARKHRVVIERLPGVSFDEVDEPSDGWPGTCSECLIPLVFDGTWEDGWRTKAGRRIYRRVGTEEEHVDLEDFGPGAMFDATHWGPESWRGEDGRCWGVVLPPARDAADIWIIDGTARDGGRWARTGEAPRLTVSPSILTPRYHSFLVDGVLGDSLPDRPLP